MLDEALCTNSETVLRRILQSLRRANPNMTLIYVTHGLTDLVEMDRILMLVGGELRAIKHEDLSQTLAECLIASEGTVSAS